ncbi:MAG: DUF3810 domain-containing protein [Acidobacteriota bacterium]
MRSSSSFSTLFARTRARLWKRATLGWLTPLSLLLACVALQRLAGFQPGFVERFYSRGLYFYLGRGISQISRPFTFSLAEVLMVALPLAGLVRVLVQTRRDLERGTRHGRIFLARARDLLWFSAVFLALFLVLFGFNYQRLPLRKGLDLSERTATTVELETMAIHIISEINRNFMDAGGTDTSPPRKTENLDRNRLFNSIEAAFQSTGLLKEAAQGGFAAPKPVFFSRLLSSAGMAGVYSPFTGEPNYNVAQPANELAFSVAHEKAHQRGYAREDEASFIAFVVCIRADDPYVRYSGFLRGLRVLTPLQEAIPGERYQKIIAALSPGVRADLQAGAEFWRRARSVRLGNVAERANNTYLRANSVRSGVRNYGEVVSLIIGYYLTYPPG